MNPVRSVAEELLARATAPEGDATPPPRTMLVFAHPDDETAALGARLGRFRDANLIHVTDGAPRDEQDSRAHGFNNLDDYRRARAREMGAALAAAGVPDMSCESLNFPDQEATLHLAELARILADRLGQHRPEVIFTHAYEGGHPDHDACAFAVHQAVRMRPGPVIIECALYHAGKHGLETCTLLYTGDATLEAFYPLTVHEQERKQKLIDCFVTQRQTLQLLTCEREQFRIASAYDFTRPPHIGPVYYDAHPWGMTSQHFCELARAAEAELERKGAAA